MHNYAIGNQVYVEMTGIYCNLDHRKKGPYIITEVFTKDKGCVQWVKVDE